jgi:hypothetical protein
MPTIPPAILDRIMEDCARRSGSERSACRVTLARSVTWRDGSLGCPERGRGYTMALVPGYWIVVEAGDARFDYRVDHLGHFRLCTHPTPPDPLPADAI